jgi:hypothetical protein
MSEKIQIQITNFSKNTITLIEKHYVYEYEIYTYIIKKLWLLNLSAPAYIFFRDEYKKLFKQFDRKTRHIINCALNARYTQCYNDNWTGLYAICHYNFPVDMAKKNVDILHDIYHFFNKIYQDNYTEENIFAVDIIQSEDEASSHE